MYYVWLNEVQAGPFTLQQLQRMWNAGQLTALNLYWQEGNPEWLPLKEILAQLEPSPSLQPQAKVETITPPTLDTMAGATQAVTERVVWAGHPSLWHWAGLLLIGIILTPLLIGIPILLHIYIQRTFTKYKVTTKRVAIEMGMFTKNARELRIQDIRSTAAQTNIFGIGTVEFSTAASADAEIIFIGLSNADYVRDMVKSLQN